MPDWSQVIYKLENSEGKWYKTPIKIIGEVYLGTGWARNPINLDKVADSWAKPYIDLITEKHRGQSLNPEIINRLSTFEVIFSLAMGNPVTRY